MADTTTHAAVDTPVAVVQEFLDALARPDLDAAMALVDDSVEYTNVSLPAMHGPARVRRFLAGIEEPGGGFGVTLHAIAADGSTVLTERTDLLVIRGVHVQIWVCGRFEVADGRITVWRDYFDWVDIARAAVRGIVGRFRPSLVPSMPAPGDDAPGR
jgi:limonene-1,2-epoxide hydrolase